MNHGSHSDGPGSGDMFIMMLMMMACCLSLVLVFALVPVIGWPAGIALFVVALAAMYFMHAKFMRHG